MDRTDSWIGRVPIVKTLAICTEAAKRDARVELYWTVGFAFLAVPIVLAIVLLTRPAADIPLQLFAVVGRGELMVYAASVCGTTLYSLRHGIGGPLPEALKTRATPLGTLTTCTGLILVAAITFYVVRRTGDINNIPLNEAVLNALSVLVLVASLVFGYVVLSLKFALNSGAAVAAHEQTQSFASQWEAERDA